MTETYDEIIKEIMALDEDSKDSITFNNEYQAIREEPIAQASTAAATVALDVAHRVREAVGGDPAEWWVCDLAGNHLHIGEKVMYGGDVRTIALLGAGGDVLDDETSYVEMNRAVKVTRDSWDRIRSDLAEALGDCGDADVWGLACSFIQRMQALTSLEPK